MTEAIELFKQLQSQKLIAMSSFKLAEIYHEIGNNQLAQTHLNVATQLAQEFSLPLIQDCQTLEAKVCSVT